MISGLIKLFLRNHHTDDIEPMKKFLIAGLGNPGPEYKYTRHNIGFLIADRLAKDLNASFKSDRYAQVSKARHRGKMLLIIKPQTYMNLSGKAVRYWLNKEKIPLENLLILTDDINLPFGQIRLRGKGSHGGHNGLKSIIELIGTPQFARLRIGIGKDFAPGEQADYVLGKWTEKEMEKLPGIIERSSRAVIHFVQEGLQSAMTEFNKKMR